jgi:hypothetical protein
VPAIVAPPTGVPEHVDVAFTVFTVEHPVRAVNVIRLEPRVSPNKLAVPTPNGVRPITEGVLFE